MLLLLSYCHSICSRCWFDILPGRLFIATSFTPLYFYLQNTAHIFIYQTIHLAPTECAGASTASLSVELCIAHDLWHALSLRTRCSFSQRNSLNLFSSSTTVLLASFLHFPGNTLRRVTHSSVCVLTSSQRIAVLISCVVQFRIRNVVSCKSE